MAATRGQRIQDDSQSDATRHHLLYRLDREAGVKKRGPAANFAAREFRVSMPLRSMRPRRAKSWHPHR